MRPKSSGTGEEAMSAINIVQWAGTPSLLTPSEGTRLADSIASLQVEPTVTLTLDFAGVDVVASSFANALFLRLSQIAPLETWRTRLDFRGLDVKQSNVIGRSLKAVRNDLHP